MRYRHEQVVSAPVASVVSFFKDARNLVRLSPPFPIMRVAADRSAVVRGTVIPINLDFGIWSMNWNARIETVGEDGSFQDTLEGSAFRSWRHLHRFETRGAGTVITDEVTWEAAWWFRPFARAFVFALFRFRTRALAKEFG